VSAPGAERCRRHARHMFSVAMAMVGGGFIRQGTCDSVVKQLCLFSKFSSLIKHALYHTCRHL